MFFLKKVFPVRVPGIAIGYNESGISQVFVLVQVGLQGFKP